MPQVSCAKCGAVVNRSTREGAASGAPTAMLPNDTKRVYATSKGLRRTNDGIIQVICLDR